MRALKGTFHIYGRQPVVEALKSNYLVEQVWLAKDIQEKIIDEVRYLAGKKGVPIKFVDKNEIQKISGAVVHQGIAAVMDHIKIQSFDNLGSFLKRKKNPFLIILDQVQDPHNVGAILRTAESCGADGIIIPEKGSAPLNDTVAKTSVGAIFHLNIFKVNKLEKVIEFLNDQQIKTCALMPNSETSMYKINLKSGVAILVGSEGAGVRKNIRKLCSNKITIPQFGKIDSLNASVATAVVLYEVVRQRHS